MTDPQLAILLRGYYERLITELDKVQEQLPEEMAVEHQTRNFLVPNGINVSTEYPVLRSLREWATSIERSIQILEGDKWS